MRAFGLLVFALLLVPATAQEGPPPPPAERPPVPIDQVVATVNDAAIMLSTLRKQTDGLIRTAQQQAGPLLRSEIQALYARALDQEIGRHALAQSAKSFGVYTPEQVEQIVASELKREEEAQVRDLGTWQEYSRELQKEGRTWQTYWREQRVEKLRSLAYMFAVSMRMEKQSNLFLTPRMLQETYRRNVDHFVRGAVADVARVLFSGPDAEQQAQRASVLWATQELSPQELKAALPGATTRVLPLLTRLDDASRESHGAALIDFAMAGPAAAVSPPLPVEQGFLVARVMDYKPPREGRFEDRDVQLELRALCMKAVIAEFQNQAMERAADRTEVWKHRAFR